MQNNKSKIRFTLIIFFTSILNFFVKAQKTIDFTISVGALIEVVYLDTEGTKFSVADIKSLSKRYKKNGGEVLAKFRTTNFPEVANLKFTSRKYSYILLVQWKDPVSRSASKANKILKPIEDIIGHENLQFGFFASQQKSSVSLSEEKAYDFTSAWLISEDPCASPALMQVIGTYFGKIGPALQKYKISNPAFLGPHPKRPSYETRLFTPHMMGVFEWSDFSDRARFTNDPLYKPHVDIRNSVLKEIDVSFSKLIL